MSRDSSSALILDEMADTTNTFCSSTQIIVYSNPINKLSSLSHTTRIVTSIPTCAQAKQQILNPPGPSSVGNIFFQEVINGFQRFITVLRNVMRQEETARVCARFFFHLRHRKCVFVSKDQGMHRGPRRTERGEGGEAPSPETTDTHF